MLMNTNTVIILLQVMGFRRDVEWQELDLLKRLKCSRLICGLNVPDAQRERIVSEIMEIAQQKNEEGKAHVKVIITIRNAEENVKHPKVLKYENLMNEMIDQAEVLPKVVPRKTIKALLDVFPQNKAILVYAATEVLTVGMQPLSQASIAKKDDYGKMYILPDIEVKIVDDEGLVVPLGTKGEICVRGPKMFLEYLEDPEGTSKAKKPTGWVHTSDYGIMYDRARIKVLGRRTDLIDTKFQAVFPVEVEEILLEHPDIQDVVAVGVPSKDEKEDICACVIQVPGSNLETRLRIS
ncbi:hypothetical protein QZH41_002195 [Actinostola sp. cb2023]|nr:hypothetical protein QZH41_002195 [Actinostola sp. cb2023]